MRSANIHLICVGTELLRGRVNTHQSHLSTRLLNAGLSFAKESSLPDEPALLRREIASALKRCDALILCGGLGPTFDDVTREAAAAALGRELIYRPSLFAAIKKKFRRFRLPIPEENKRQAFVIRGARVLKNERGSAPGQMLRLLRPGLPPQTVVLLPGPPGELFPMFDAQVLPRLKRTYARGVFAQTMTLHLCGIPESLADERLQPLIAQTGPRLNFTILAAQGQVDFFARATAPAQAEARAAIARLRRQAYEAVGAHIFGEGEETLESVVGKRLLRRRLTLAAAESCTGGMLGERLTSVAGSSGYFKGGVIAYSNDLKALLLKVSAATLARRGAVSAACALEMAEGVRAACGAGVGAAITGIAGPSGATAGKPVGLVFIAVAGPGKARRHRRLLLPGGRDDIRRRAAAAALQLILRSLDEKAN